MGVPKEAGDAIKGYGQFLIRHHKPNIHLDRYCKKWVCKSFTSNTIGFGESAKEAYDSWKLKFIWTELNKCS